MRQDLTELVFVLDRSGSMGFMKDEAIGGFNAFLEEQKTLDGEANLTLVLFDHRYKVIHSGKNIQDVPNLCKETYVPSGTTALLDAIGRTVDDVGKRLSEMPEEERPSKVLVAILTDGMENASKDYKKLKINEMITHQRGKYSWEFVFLGANQDAFSEGVALGMLGQNTMTYDCSEEGIADTFYSLSCATSSYRSTGKVDLKAGDDENK